MTFAVSAAPKRCGFLFSCASCVSVIALACVSLPSESWSQSAQPGWTLDPVVVQPPPASSRAPRPTTTADTKRAARTIQRRPAQPASATPVVAQQSAPGFAAPTLNLTGSASTGSRLGLTRLQTPASVDVISAETMAERGQHDVIDAVTQNAVGFTASPEPGNGSLSFNTRGFTGNGSVMMLYDGTRLYVGSGTLTFPYDTWSSQ